MPNHFHIMIFTNNNLETNKLNNAIGTLLRSYTRAINLQEKRKGSLFQQKTKAKELVESRKYNSLSYPAICAHYIHQNPIIAGLTDNLIKWKFSSFLDYAEIRNGYLCDKELFFQLTGIKQDEFVTESEYRLKVKQSGR